MDIATDSHVLGVRHDVGVRALAGDGSNESSASAISWAAVLAGAFVAAAMALILLALGTGLGLSSVSPWENTGASARTVGLMSAGWLALMQIIAGALGGYIAGRLRTKWVATHTDEVFFRDTAHGLLVWAVGVVISAALLTSAASSLVGTAAKIGATGAAVAGAAGMAGVAGSTALGTSPTQGTGGSSNSYFVDRMFRATAPTAGAAVSTAPDSRDSTTALRTEAGRIFARGLQDETIAPADRVYLAQMIATQTGTTQADAESRVDAAITDAKAAADKARAAADDARKAAAHASLWIFISLLIGAFSATYAATLGGRIRDRVTV